MQQCRICLEREDVKLLLQPCHCTGSIQYVHPVCLRTWLLQRFKRQYRQLLTQSQPSDSATGLRCELCSTEYRGRRCSMHWLKAVKVVLTSGTTLRLVLSSMFLGYLLCRMGKVFLDTILYAHSRKPVIRSLPSLRQRLLALGGLWMRVWVNTAAMMLLGTAMKVFTRDVVDLCRLLSAECKEFRISPTSSLT